MWLYRLIWNQQWQQTVRSNSLLVASFSSLWFPKKKEKKILVFFLVFLSFLHFIFVCLYDNKINHIKAKAIACNSITSYWHLKQDSSIYFHCSLLRTQFLYCNLVFVTFFFYFSLLFVSALFFGFSENLCVCKVEKVLRLFGFH